MSGMQARIFRSAHGIERDAKQAELREHLELKFDGKIKAPPSGGVLMVGLPGFLALLYN